MGARASSVVVAVVDPNEVRAGLATGLEAEEDERLAAVAGRGQEGPSTLGR